MKNIVLTGYMGTGKTTVGREVARQLAWPFVDMDSLIESRQGRTVRQIFEQDGEPYFRQLEAALCREIAANWQGQVVATGGGALVNVQNLAMLTPQNLVVCLDCDPQVLSERLAQATDRPLLDGPAPQERLLALLRERQPAYARIPHHVDTTLRPVEAISADILRLWQAANGE